MEPPLRKSRVTRDREYARRTMRLVRGIFYFEVVSNLGTAVLALLFPAFFVGQFVKEPLPIAAVELWRWYAVLLVVLSLILWAALRDGDSRFLRSVIAAYLVGDAFQIVVSIRFGLAAGDFAFAVHAAVWTSVAYAAARTYYLRATRVSFQ